MNLNQIFHIYQKCHNLYVEYNNFKNCFFVVILLILPHLTDRTNHLIIYAKLNNVELPTFKNYYSKKVFKIIHKNMFKIKLLVL